MIKNTDGDVFTATTHPLVDENQIANLLNISESMRTKRYGVDTYTDFDNCYNDTIDYLKDVYDSPEQTDECSIVSNDVEAYVSNIKKVLLNDYKNNPKTMNILVNLNYVKTVDEASMLFNNFVNDVESTESFIKGYHDFVKSHEGVKPKYNSMLAEAHEIFTGETVENPYISEFSKVDNQINIIKDKVWKKIKPGEYVDGRVKITKKTRCTLTINFWGIETIKFSKKDMSIIDPFGFHNYFNLWKNDFCMPVYQILEDSSLYDLFKNMDDTLMATYFEYCWENRPYFIKESWNKYINYLSDFPRPETYKIRVLDTGYPLDFFRNTIIHYFEEKLKQNQPDFNTSNVELKNILIDTKWDEISSDVILSTRLSVEVV